MMMQNIESIVFFGPPGSGKGTQIQLAQKLLTNGHEHIYHLSTGDAFRTYRPRSEELAIQWTKAQADMKAARLVDDLPVCMLASEYLAVASELDSYDSTRKMHPFNPSAMVVAWDGFPRTIGQAEYLQRNTALRLIVSLHPSQHKDAVIDMLQRRSDGRREEAERRIAAGEPDVAVRPDDLPGVMTGRVTRYYANELPVINHFENLGTVPIVRVDPFREPAQVLEDILPYVKDVLVATGRIKG
jgi:adenylate kinase